MYPKILSEDETLDQALQGKSLARYGDGELRVALGGGCISQLPDPLLAKELCQVLTEDKAYLPCIPNVFSGTPKIDSWQKYATQQFTRLYPLRSYGSSFITRPDSAPWIDREDYWAKVERLWKDKDVTLVMGTERSLRSSMMTSAKSIREVWASKHRDAYAEIAKLEEEIGRPSGPILLCLGCTATVLAARLARKGLWAIDVGHIGMFMRARGGFRLKFEDIVSDGRRQALIERHAKEPNWGAGGHEHATIVKDFTKELGCRLVLDYGSGKGTLKKALGKVAPEIRVWEFDPCVPGKEGFPKVAEIVVCTDVLEEVELDKIAGVLRHISAVADKGLYIQISGRCSPAEQENWETMLVKSGFKILRSLVLQGEPTRHRLWLKKLAV